MFSPSDYNDAVPQFSNGNYANEPLNPLYVEEPDDVNYKRGAEPLQTLPVQWWNWFINKFTSRFNKLNIYVKNLFNELAQLLSLVNVKPDGTEGSITDGQLKNAFKELYPDYINTKLKLATTYTPQTRTINKKTLDRNITLTGEDIDVSQSDSTTVADKFFFQPRDLYAESRFNGDLYNQCILNGTYTADKYVTDKGTLADAVGLGASDYIPITGGSLYEYVLTNASGVARSEAGCFYDRNKVKVVAIRKLTAIDNTIFVPENVAFVRFTIGLTQATGSAYNYFKRLDALQQNSVLKGMKIAVLGDSITFGHGLENQDQRYSNVLARMSGATVLNYGVSGSKMSEIDGDEIPSFVERVSQIDKTCDKVVIFGGTNDYWHNKTAIGFRTMTSPDHLCGAVNTLITYLENNGFTNKDIVFVIPTLQSYADGNSFEDRGNHFGTFVDFRNAIIRTCGYRSIPVIDLFTCGKIDIISNPSLKDYYTTDGLHLNFRGHYIVAKAIYDFFQSNTFTGIGITQSDALSIGLEDKNQPISTLDLATGWYEEKADFATARSFSDSPSSTIQLLKSFIGSGANPKGDYNVAVQMVIDALGKSPNMWFKNTESDWQKVIKEGDTVAGIDLTDSDTADILPAIGTIVANSVSRGGTNNPTTDRNWWIITFRPNKDLAVQMACAGNGYACRYYYAGTWYEWSIFAKTVTQFEMDTVKAILCNDEYSNNNPHNEDVDSFLESGKTKTCGMNATNTEKFPALGWWTVISMGWYSTNKFGTQLIMQSQDLAEPKMYYRIKWDGTWQNWQRVTMGDANGFPSTVQSIIANTANTAPANNNSACMFFVPAGSPETIDINGNTWILCWKNDNVAVQLGCNGTTTAVRYRYGDDGSWTAWNKQALASDLGDQVTYNLSGTTLTITTK